MEFLSFNRFLVDKIFIVYLFTYLYIEMDGNALMKLDRQS